MPDGYAGQPVTLSGSGTVTVTASSGQYSASLDVVYEEAPAEEGRKAYVDSNGDAVYLIAKDSGTVGVDDFLALVAAFGSSEGDDNYNVQADVTPSMMAMLTWMTSSRLSARLARRLLFLASLSCCCPV